jgi:hypothetical protein
VSSDDFGKIVSAPSAPLTTLDTPEVHIVPPAVPRFPLPLLSAVQGQQAAVQDFLKYAAEEKQKQQQKQQQQAGADASAASTTAAAAASSSSASSPFAQLIGSLGSLSLPEIAGVMLLPSWSSAVLPSLPQCLVTANAAEKASPAQLAAVKQMLLPEVEARKKLAQEKQPSQPQGSEPQQQAATPEPLSSSSSSSSLLSSNDQLTPLLPLASFSALKNLASRAAVMSGASISPAPSVSSSDSPAFGTATRLSPVMLLQLLLPTPTCHFIRTPLTARPIHTKAESNLCAVGVQVWWRTQPRMQRFRLHMMPSLMNKQGAQAYPNLMQQLQQQQQQASANKKKGILLCSQVCLFLTHAHNGIVYLDIAFISLKPPVHHFIQQALLLRPSFVSAI